MHVLSFTHGIASCSVYETAQLAQLIGRTPHFLLTGSKILWKILHTKMACLPLSTLCAFGDLLRGCSSCCPADQAIAGHNLGHSVPFHEQCPDFLDPILRAFWAGDSRHPYVDNCVAPSLFDLEGPATHSHDLYGPFRSERAI